MRRSPAISRPGNNREGSTCREEGQVLVFFVLLLPVLIGAAALLVDLAAIVRVQSQLRATAGSAARAGAWQVSVPGLALMDWFALSAGDARSAAQRLCDASAADESQGLECTVDVSEVAFTPPDGNAFTLAAWALFLGRDNTNTPLQPGWTVHGAVTVTARRRIPLFFLPVLTHERFTEVAASQTATLMSGP